MGDHQGSFLVHRVLFYQRLEYAFFSCNLIRKLTSRNQPADELETALICLCLALCLFCIIRAKFTQLKHFMFGKTTFAQKLTIFLVAHMNLLLAEKDY